jgi:hypothetical protein
MNDECRMMKQKKCIQSDIMQGDVNEVFVGAHLLARLI